MEQLLSYDRHLFKIINSGWSNPFFDWLMPFLRNSHTWYPLYFFLLLLAVVNYKKTGWWWALFAAGTIILCDFVSSDIIKKNFFRLRPCNVPDYASWIKVLVGYRPQSSSFTSSHATTHFGMAMFFYLSLKPAFATSSFKNGLFIFFFWAFSIAFAQVYVGVHYPLDVACGGLIGILIGYLSGKSFNKNYGLV
ncbi:MAG: phosphatase PAP2 family protein [Ferruginibacter sp.]|nr:phosphatase PAP2 family protein [Ferruginibacter sp.]